MKNPTFYSVIDIKWYIFKNIKIFQKMVDLQLRYDIIVSVVDIKQHFSEKR